ncbi:hypothetical protein D3C72_1386750 [compost metagenome]
MTRKVESMSGFTRKNSTSTLSTLRVITGRPSARRVGSSEPRLAKPMVGCMSRVSRRLIDSLSSCLPLTASRPLSTVSTSLRCGSRWRRCSSIWLSESSQAPSSLPLTVSTRCTLLAKSCLASSGAEKLIDSVAAPSSCTSETSSTVSSRPS